MASSKALDAFVAAKKGEFLVGSEFSIADIAEGAFLGHGQYGPDEVRHDRVEGKASRVRQVLGVDGGPRKLQRDPAVYVCVD
jgi:glutathione S-transferase